MKSASFFVLFGIVSACSQAFNATRVQEEAVDMLYRYHDAIESDGLLAEFKFLDDTDAFFWVPPGYSTALDYDSVRTILTINAPSVRMIEIEWESLEVMPLSADIASFHGIVNSVMTDTDGLLTETRLLESGTLIRRKDGWKLLSGQTHVLRADD